MESPHISELIRRLENLLRAGTIEQVDTASALVRVRCGGLLSSWVRWFSRRAGDVRTWSPPCVGEQCLLLSPGGDLANGMALVGLFSDAMPADDDRAITDATRFPDGSLLEYNHASHQHLLQCVGDVVTLADGDVRCEAQGKVATQAGQDVTTAAGGDLTIKAGGAVVIEAATTLTLRVGATVLTLGAGGMSGSPDIVVDGVSLTQHAHSKVRTGSDLSGPPAGGAAA